MQLNSVVLPAPFGPITATIAPRGISSDTSRSACTPPNAMLTPRARSSASALGRSVSCGRLVCAYTPGASQSVSFVHLPPLAFAKYTLSLPRRLSALKLIAGPMFWPFQWSAGPVQLSNVLSAS